MQAPSIVNGGNSGIAAGRSNLPWLIAAGLALLALMAGFVAWRRRRAANEELYYEEAAYEPGLMVEQPVANAGDRAASDYQPQIVAPVPAFRRVAAAASPQAEAELSAADRADMDALATSSDPHANRPWLEFLMRPVRAGTSGEDALIEFELTVGNTGSVPAEDVRISTWMFADDGKSSEMERMLIDPPANAATSQTRIDAGEGARVDTKIAVPRGHLAGDVLPVVVADARYRLPDGREGRTAARFAVGLPSGDGLAPFAVALGAGVRDDVEVRLHGEPEHA